MKKLLFWLYMGIIFFSLVATLLLPPLDWMHFWDTMFALSLLLSIIGASILIINSGLFQPFFKNLKYFFRKINRAEHIADQVEQKGNDSYTYSAPTFLAKPCLITGLSLVIISSFFSIIL